MMRILHLINPLLGGGAERLVVDMAINMKQKGYDVTVASLTDQRTPLWSELKAADVPIIALSNGKSNYNPSLILPIRKLIQDFSVVHVHLFPSQYWASMAKATSHFKGVMVTTEHSTFNVRCKYTLTTLLDRWAYTAYDSIVCVSPATADFMRKRTKGRNRIDIIENGVNLNRFKDVEASREQLFPFLGTSDLLLIQVARFRNEKNQDCVIRAMKQLPENIHVAFAGDGPCEEKCKQLAQDLEVTNRVHFLGFRADAPQLMAAADIVVLASHWESFGLSAVEGMALGKPVIASNVEGLAQVINEKNLLFEADNETDLAKKLLPLCRDTTFREKMSNFCKQNAAKYDLNITVEKHINLYQDLLENKEK